MTNVRIKWLVDNYDCGQAGCSGGYAEGAEVYFDGELVLDLSPAAACFDSIHYDQEDVFRHILSALGHNLEGVSYDG